MSKKESKPDIRKEIVDFAKERNCSVKQATIEVLKLLKNPASKDKEKKWKKSTNT